MLLLYVKKHLSLIFGLGAAAVICPAILYSVAKAQENSDCYIVDPSGQIRVCSPGSEGQESTFMENSQYFIPTRAGVG